MVRFNCQVLPRARAEPIQIDVIHAALNKRRDGVVEVLGHSGNLVFEGSYAEKLWAAYQEQLKTGAGKWDLRILLCIEVEEPTGQIDSTGVNR